MRVDKAGADLEQAGSRTEQLQTHLSHWLWRYLPQISALSCHRYGCRLMRLRQTNDLCAVGIHDAEDCPFWDFKTVRLPIGTNLNFIVTLRPAKIVDREDMTVRDLAHDAFSDYQTLHLRAAAPYCSYVSSLPYSCFYGGLE